MVYLEIVFLVALILLNGVLAMSEMAMASSRTGRLKSMAGDQVAGARRALALASDPGRFLSTVQIGITLIGILAGAFSGAKFSERVVDWLRGAGMPEHLADPAGFGLVVGSITYLSLVVGELAPKQVALRNPERIACLVAPAMTLLARFAAPLVWLLDRSGRVALAVIGHKRSEARRVSDAEIHALIAEAESAGVLAPAERSMISGVMRLGDRPARTVMTPRADVVMIDLAESPASTGKQIAESGHSRFVAYEKNRDNIVGVIQSKDIAAASMRRRTWRLRQLVKQAPVIPDTLDALTVVARLKDSDVHFGLVYDEYGQFEGIVTAADILEAIVGAFRQGADAPEPELLERSDGSLLLAGSSSADLLADRFGIRLSATPGFHTVAGFMLDRLGHIPELGDSFSERGFRFEVVDLDGRRIDKVLVTRLDRLVVSRT